MSEDFIDTAIAEGIASESAQAKTEVTPEIKPEVKPEPVKEELPKEEKVESEDSDKEDDTPFPKKAVNALSKRDKQIGKLRAEKQQIAAELEKLRQQNAPKEATAPQDGRPSEKDFNNYAEYLEAVQDWKLEQKLSALEKKQTETVTQAQSHQRIVERSQAVDVQAAEFAKSHPEVEGMYIDNAELVKSLPDNIKLALLHADSPPLAFYNLAKEGKLADLADMSLEDAKVEIRLAQMKQPAKAQTKAPAPLPAARGSVPSGKSLESMSPEQLGEWMKT